MVLGALFSSALLASDTLAAEYDPLALNTSSPVAHVDLVLHDVSRARDIPLRVYLPATQASAPVILFSHGLGGSRAGSAFLGQHWAGRGYVAVFVQHPGSDDSVWKDASAGERMRAMKQAASMDNFLLRVQDVRSVLDQLGLWNTSKTNELASRLNLERIGMSGHSFGAVTTEAVSGETLPLGGNRYTDPRIRAALILSPSAPRGSSSARAFASVKIPWLLMTGTKDLAPISDVDIESRRAVYPALQGAPKYELVLHNAEHSVFIDRALPGDLQPRNPNHHRVILALSTAFWDAYLGHNPEALTWLNGAGPRSVMESEDQWQCSANEVGTGSSGH